MFLVGVVSATMVGRPFAQSELHGIVRVSSKPAADVLVWLDVPGERPSRKLPLSFLINVI